jgi:hypothetical protein
MIGHQNVDKQFKPIVLNAMAQATHHNFSVPPVLKDMYPIHDSISNKQQP